MEQKLRRLLAQRHRVRVTDSTRTQAAVLAPVFLKEGQYHLLFIKRTDKVRVHKGQISFPGGVYEKSDGSLLNTALRESAEEIGLAAEGVQILGELDDEVSVSTNFVITPFLGLIPYPYQFNIDGHEVYQILEIPISALREKDAQHEEVLPDNRITYSYRYQKEIIWGATARILKKLLDVLGEVL